MLVSVPHSYRYLRLSKCKFILFYKLPFLLWSVLVLGVLNYSLTCKLLRLSLYEESLPNLTNFLDHLTVPFNLADS